MCEKQCRDANGFKCHCESEGHQRNMILFSQNSGKLLNQFSHEFEQAFLDIVKRRARTQFILANQVYNELISDRQHTHMNATIWVTLGNFVKHLGKSGKCKVEERPKGWSDARFSSCSPRFVLLTRSSAGTSCTSSAIRSW